MAQTWHVRLREVYGSTVGLVFGGLGHKDTTVICVFLSDDVRFHDVFPIVDVPLFVLAMSHLVFHVTAQVTEHLQLQHGESWF